MRGGFLVILFKIMNVCATGAYTIRKRIVINVLDTNILWMCICTKTPDFHAFFVEMAN